MEKHGKTIGGMTYPHLQAVTLACHGLAMGLGLRHDLLCDVVHASEDGDPAETAGTKGGQTSGKKPSEITLW